MYADVVMPMWLLLILVIEIVVFAVLFAVVTVLWRFDARSLPLPNRLRSKQFPRQETTNHP